MWRQLERMRAEKPSFSTLRKMKDGDTCLELASKEASDKNTKLFAEQKI
jgi:hypothetical protein